MTKFEKPKLKILNADEKSAIAVISKGGQVPNTNIPNEDVFRVQLRLNSDLMTQIDQNRSTRKPKPSRHSWLLEAIYEKLEREE